MSQEKFMTWLKSGSDEMCMLKTPSSECAYFRHKLSNGLDIIYRKAVYAYTCAHCGKPFTAYGNKERKYCSHNCYISDRFGEEREARD